MFTERRRFISVLANAGDGTMHIFDYIALGSAVTFALSLFAVFILVGLPLP
jgi:hypothetical protein